MNEFLEKLRALPDAERIAASSTFKWIGYTQSDEILQKMEFLKNYPSSLRMPNVLLVSDSNNGKTRILDRFQKLNKPYINDINGELHIPALYIEAPVEPDERRFYNLILHALSAPINASERIEIRQSRVIHLLKKTNVKLLMIDEIHHVLSGTMNKQRTFLNIIKSLSNNTKISFLCAGTRAAFNAINTDTQLINRFEPYILKNWQYNNEYSKLLKSFEQVLPLRKRSDLTDTNLSKQILFKSEGLIGEISKILELSSILAIKSGHEKIDLKILDDIRFTIPSNRNKEDFILR
ncbi:TniB family NTP-binding protein [Flavobacterium aquidurense]|uniref:TniB family NTP-binding protein n=1 Tax=Flavobacterium aquidurense TaxID=362413 RepID=UPI003757AA6E